MKIYATEQSRLDSLSQIMAYNNYCMSNNDNRTEIEKMKRHLLIAFNLELTERQKQCITQYYLHNMKMVDIAKEMGITACVVSRHISRGIDKLKKTLPYYYGKK